MSDKEQTGVENGDSAATGTFTDAGLMRVLDLKQGNLVLTPISCKSLTHAR